MHFPWGWKYYLWGTVERYDILYKTDVIFFFALLKIKLGSYIIICECFFLENPIWGSIRRKHTLWVGYSVTATCCCSSGSSPSLCGAAAVPIAPLALARPTASPTPGPGYMASGATVRSAIPLAPILPSASLTRVSSLCFTLWWRVPGSSSCHCIAELEAGRQLDTHPSTSLSSPPPVFHECLSCWLQTQCLVQKRQPYKNCSISLLDCVWSNSCKKSIILHNCVWLCFSDQTLADRKTLYKTQHDLSFLIFFPNTYSKYLLDIRQCARHYRKQIR